jgi:hypothetical protein
VCAVVANRVTDTMVKEGVETSIDVANEAVRILQQWDQQTAAAGRTAWFPEVGK